MTTLTGIDSGYLRQSNRRLWWSAAVHAAILLLCLAIGTIPPTPASAIERQHITLIAPAPAIAPPPRPKKVASVEPKVQPKTDTVELKREPARVIREFVPPPQKSVLPVRQAPIEIAALRPIETAPSLISLAEPLSSRELPPAPIVVGRLSSATSGGASEQRSAATARASGFSTSSSSAGGADTKSARIVSSGFQGAAIATTSSPKATTRTAVLTRPIEILKKPQPVYTEEARALRLEGEVLLEVLFTASAEVRVLRVTRGLGHGLDEAAVASASRIEFRPALREGEPTDQTVTVHIRFQLAY